MSNNNYKHSYKKKKIKPPRQKENVIKNLMNFIKGLFSDDIDEEELDPVSIPKDLDYLDGKPKRKKKRIPTYHDYDWIGRAKRFFRFHWRGCLVISTPILLTPLLFDGSMEKKAGFVYVLCVVFWVTECLPIMVTSMLPIVLLPLLGIFGSDVTCRSYFKDTTMVMVGGLMIALSVEYSNLHRRLSLMFIKVFSCYPRRLHIVLMLVTYLISNVMSNTATAAIMCSVVKAVLDVLHEQGIMEIYEDMKTKRPTAPVIAFYLGTAYSATIGGMGSLIGSGTNMAFKYGWTEIYAELNDVTKVEDKVFIEYYKFMEYCLPISFLLFCATCLYLQIYLMGLWRPSSDLARTFKDMNKVAKEKQDTFKSMYRNQHRITCHEISVSILIVILMVLYFTRSPDFMKGWKDLVSTK